MCRKMVRGVYVGGVLELREEARECRKPRSWERGGGMGGRYQSLPDRGKKGTNPKRKKGTKKEDEKKGKEEEHKNKSKLPNTSDFL